MIELDRITKERHGRTSLSFNTGQTLEAPSRVVNELDLEEGESYRLEKLREDVEELSRKILPERARSHLAQYTKTTSEFHEHFTRKGYAESLVREVAARLKEEGALDDEAIARRHVEKRLSNKHYGRRKIIVELREKGIPSDRARSLVDELYSSEREREKAREYLEENDGLEPGKKISRLKNRGFPGSVIRDLVGYPT